MQERIHIIHRERTRKTLNVPEYSSETNIYTYTHDSRMRGDTTVIHTYDDITTRTGRKR